METGNDSYRFKNSSTQPKSGSALAIQAYIRIKLVTALRRGDLLRLTMSDLKDEAADEYMKSLERLGLIYVDDFFILEEFVPDRCSFEVF